MIPGGTLIRSDPERRLLQLADAGGCVLTTAELRYIAATIELLRQELAEERRKP